MSIDKTINAIKDIRRAHPKSARGDVSNIVLKYALEQGGEYLNKIIHLVDAYTDLRVRGYNAQAAFIVTFINDSNLNFSQALAMSAEGTDIIESAHFYRSNFKMMLSDIDIGTLWNPIIAADMLERLADNAASVGIANEALALRATVLRENVQHGYNRDLNLKGVRRTPILH